MASSSGLNLNTRASWGSGAANDLTSQISALIEAGRYQEAAELAKRIARGEHLIDRQRPLCGAMTRKGTPCQAPAYWPRGEKEPRNGRCRMHGGLATGPKTPEGKARIAAANKRRAKERRRQKRDAYLARSEEQDDEQSKEDQHG